MIKITSAILFSLILHIGVIAAIFYISTIRNASLPSLSTQPLLLTLAMPETPVQDKPKVDIESSWQPMASQKKPMTVIKRKSLNNANKKAYSVKKISRPLRSNDILSTQSVSNTSTIASQVNAPLTSTQPSLVNEKNINKQQLLKRIKPTYPPKASALGIEGQVRVEYDIDHNGRIVNIKVVKAIPPNIFEHEVKSALKKWRYSSGHAQQQIKLTIQFNLKKGTIVQ